MSRARARVGLREMRRGGVSSARSLVHGGSEEGGADREGPRRREREKGRVGQRLGVWQNEPARHRGKMGARGGGGGATGTDKLAPLGWERERGSARGQKPPLTGGAHLSGSAGARPGWTKLGWLGCFAFFFFSEFSNDFPFLFYRGFNPNLIQISNSN
jgi:hypothetical protein